MMTLSSRAVATAFASMLLMSSAFAQTARFINRPLPFLFGARRDHGEAGREVLGQLER